MIRVLFPGQSVPTWLEAAHINGVPFTLRVGCLSVVWCRDRAYHWMPVLSRSGPLIVVPNFDSRYTLHIHGQSPSNGSKPVTLHGETVLDKCLPALIGFLLGAGPSK